MLLSEVLLARQGIFIESIFNLYRGISKGQGKSRTVLLITYHIPDLVPALGYHTKL
jgi:hypothetical protein